FPLIYSFCFSFCLYIFDNLGRMVYEEKISQSIIEINTQEFNSGIYTVVVSNDAGQSKPQKLIIGK
ncbi:MAG: T9SS type A sorting domain-containing protein, partial [Bacteroidota bacterium]